MIFEKQLKSLLFNISLLFFACVLFASIFPSGVISYGFGFLSPMVLVPVGILLQRIRLYWSLSWGFFYGFLSYGLFNIWLITFSPVAFSIVPLIYGVYFIVVFFLLKLAQIYFPRYGFIIQAMIWLVYEYTRTNGFLGYSFGVLGYALSFYPLLIQSADLFGVWGVTFLLASISFYLAQLFRDCITSTLEVQNRKEIIPRGSKSNKVNLCTMLVQLKFLHKNTQYKYYFIGLVASIVFIIVYGITMQKNTTHLPSARIALIQHNTDPWKGGYTAYKTSLENLIAQTTLVMDSENPPETVVWSETSFVPSIAYHLKYRETPQYTRLIQELFNFLGKYPTTEFLIGNGEGIKVAGENGNKVRKNYNAALFFRGKELLDTYYKIHLVPFTEYFPYKILFSRFYQFLKDNDVHFWLKGTTHTVFEGKKIKFSTPICFEDGFGLQNARFVKEGAQVLINITNDAWSHVESNAMQHLQLSIFRAVENRRSVARSTNGGITAIIDMNGIIQSMLPSFEISSLVYDIPLNSNNFSIYTRWGDWFVYMILIMLCTIIIVRSIVWYRKSIEKH